MSHHHVLHVDAFGGDDVERFELLFLIAADVECDRRAGQTGGSSARSRALTLVVGERFAIDADFTDDSGPYPSPIHAKDDVANDDIGKVVDRALVHVERMERLRVPTSAHDDVQAASVADVEQRLRIASQPDIGDVDHRAAADVFEL